MLLQKNAAFFSWRLEFWPIISCQLNQALWTASNRNDDPITYIINWAHCLKVSYPDRPNLRINRQRCLKLWYIYLRRGTNFIKVTRANIEMNPSPWVGALWRIPGIFSIFSLCVVIVLSPKNSTSHSVGRFWGILYLYKHPLSTIRGNVPACWRVSNNLWNNPK